MKIIGVTKVPGTNLTYRVPDPKHAAPEFGVCFSLSFEALSFNSTRMEYMIANLLLLKEANVSGIFAHDIAR